MKGKIRNIPCIDFTEWFSQFKAEDEIVLKMNIEGAEFDILEKMIETGELKKVKRLFVEWHDEKVEPNMRDRRIEIERYCRANGIYYVSWRRVGIINRDLKRFGDDKK